MQLIHYTIRNLAIVLLIILIFWAGLFYFRVIDEVNDETDDSLENYCNIIIRRAMADSTILYGNSTDIMTKYSITEISKAAAGEYQQRFSDSVMYIEEEMEHDPVRVLQTAFRTGDGRYYELKIMTSILEKDDLQEAILKWTIGLYLILSLSVILVAKIIFKKSLRPLYHLLDWLNHFTLGLPNSHLNNPTSVKEFKILNDTISRMVRRNEEIFVQQKQFIENASHELQTPLAICQNKLEFLADNPSLSEQQLSELGEIHETLNRAIRLNRSLLLLSRIENQQHYEVKELEINKIINNLIPDIEDIYQHKEIKTSIQESAPLVVVMNESLAAALLTNLLKNAYIHNDKGGIVQVNITRNELTVSNTCGTLPLEEEKIFERFYHSADKEESTGLGLAIVKSIANLYNIRISYKFDTLHRFTLRFPSDKADSERFYLFRNVLGIWGGKVDGSNVTTTIK